MVDQAREYIRPRSRGSSLEADAVVVDIENDVVDLRNVIDLRRLEQVQGHERVYLEAGEGILGAPLWGRQIKRFVDIVAAVFFLIVLSPIMLIAAVAVKLTSPGPIFYIQERVGKGGEVFRFAKFRSMLNGAHTQRDDLGHLNEVDGPIFKIKNDPRITPVGRFMRKYSIDELPQLFHVMTGKMSLVGPRPPLPAEVATYSAWHRQRLLVRPGITCIWQVSGRSDLDFETWVSLDIEYIQTWRPWLDFVILLKTVPAVITAKGAY